MGPEATSVRQTLPHSSEGIRMVGTAVIPIVDIDGEISTRSVSSPVVPGKPALFLPSSCSQEINAREWHRGECCSGGCPSIISLWRPTKLPRQRECDPAMKITRVEAIPLRL